MTFKTVPIWVVSSADEMTIQTLHEQGYGAKAIMAAYPQNYWKPSMVKKICRHVDQTGSLTERKAGSGRPKSACSDTNVERVEELICSKKNGAASTLAPVRLPLNSIPVTDLSVILRKKISVV